MLTSETIPFPGTHGHSELADDATLIRFLQADCDQCFDVLFEGYWKLVFAISWKILHERRDAEDIVQEVFLAIYLQRHSYDSNRGSVRTWIAQFAHFKALMKRRYRRSRELTTLEDFSAFESGLSQFGTFDGVLERAAIVEECLASLNSQQRRAIELVHFEGNTLLETSTALGQSLANTRNLYYRGMKALRTQLSAPRTHMIASGSNAKKSISSAAAESFAFETDL